MERRSTRLKSQTHTASREDEEASGSDYEMLEDAPVLEKKKPQRKVQKRKKTEDTESNTDGKPPVKKVRGKRGMLKELFEMPLDILFEIFGQLEPIDLLHLARTTKDLRAILMKRSSISVWKSARSKIIDLPSCPDDLSEPQYAELAFGRRCFCCQRNVSSNILSWELRMRICSKCVLNSEKFTTCYRPDCPYQLQSLLPSIEVNDKKVLSTGRPTTYYPTELIASWASEYANAGSGEGQTTWTATKIDERTKMLSHAKACARWVANVEAAQEIEKAKAIEHRQAIILERIKKLGWADELTKMTQREQDNLLTDPPIAKACRKDITVKVLDSLDDHLVDFMVRVKNKRVKEERKNLLKERVTLLDEVITNCGSTQPHDFMLPNIPELFLHPLVKDIILNTPTTRTFTLEDLNVVTESFSDICLELKLKTEKKLFDYVVEACGSKQDFDPSTVLGLATTTFSCSGCCDVLRPPRVLVHRCARDTRFGAHYSLRDTEDNDLQTIADMCNRQCAWNSTGAIQYKPETYDTIADVVRMCGLDPTTTTAQAMDNANFIFECLDCNDLRRGRCTMAWTSVVSHQVEHAKTKGGASARPTLVLLKEEEAVRVRERLAEDRERKRSEYYFNGFRCGHCKETSGLVSLTDHLENVHGIAEPTDKDIVQVLDYDHTFAIFRLWPPRRKHKH
ncbi:hypothetical protein B0H34DRAFT_295051 [Crassisporium funariophilum]|nr:hypothetical protein B0H34DRAFT_295051 [Crassisporium funariophilum]